MNNKTSHPKYRPDIDGLRALAVIPVVLFHAFPDSITGGYVGVDIFFVISGYLISLIILKNFNNDSFSFFDFYVRRIRRIFPTLTTVLVFSLLFGWFALFPDEYSQLGKHVAGSSVFISNFVLLSESGYFDSASISKPLLHLWSLAVEEQFYIVWPLLLVFFRKLINPIFMALALLALTFAANIYFIDQNQSLAFYSPVMRFWEILCGSCLAWCQVNKQSISSRFDGKVPAIVSLFINNDGRSAYRHIISIAGLSLIAIAMYSYTEGLAFPGWYAIAPVVGAVMLILAGPHAFVNKFILSRRIVIWFGLISYPLYLWHWPLISFSYIMESGYPTYEIQWAIVGLSVLLAWLSYRFIEKNLRGGNYPIRKTIGLILAMVAIGCTGLYIFTSDGVPSRFEKSAAEVKDDAYIHAFTKKTIKLCDEIFPDWKNKTDNLCAMQKQSGQNEIALIGDSHTNHLYLGLSELYSDRGVAVFPASCASPFINVASGMNNKAEYEGRRYTYKLINQAYDYVLKDKKITDVVLAHNPGCSYRNAIDITNPGEKDSSKILEAGMRRTLDALSNAGKHVTVVIDNPELQFDPKACIVRPLRLTRAGEKCSYDRAVYDNNSAHKTYKEMVYRVAKDYPNLRIVDLSKTLCDAKKCTLFADGHEIYKDRSHFNKYGSRYVAPLILKGKGDQN